MTILEELQAAGLPVISADESGAVSMGPMTEEQLAQFHDILLAHFNPTKHAETLQERSERQQFKDQYQAIIDRLTQIENATNPTNAQVIAAVRDLARYERLTLRALAKLYN